MAAEVSGHYEFAESLPYYPFGASTMKKRLLALLFCFLLLAACVKPETPTTAATTEAPALSLAGVWVNAGQYSEGRDFVETLTLNENGTAQVHLDYQGKPYADLEGTWTADGTTLSVDFTDPNTRDRVYTYALTETTLTLTGSGKDVQYLRQN